MLLITLLVLAGLAPGVATAWFLRRHGRLISLLAGAGVTVALPFLLLVTLVAVPPLGFALGLLAAAAALRAVDDGRVWVATAWAGVAVVAISCAGWSL
ncbi:hypothetical protein [Streptomyces sp. NPDC005760]|uniref:hypothetical protein n=1 Tax=Streptomyces sp. NPDC005760 TaxID=3156718 RepID=UPI000FB12A70